MSHLRCALAALVVTQTAAGLVSLLPSTSAAQTLQFGSDGEMQITVGMVGQRIRVIAVGGGGGGSGATAQFQTLRPGAGGGSGGINYFEFDVTEPGVLSWRIGSGGKHGDGWFAGEQRPGWTPHGGAGGTTEVRGLPASALVLATGGEGGIDVNFGTYTVGGDYHGKVPPLGGSGGIPWGNSGSNGVTSLRVASPGEVIAGGQPGTLAGVAGGAGGAGGGSSSYRPFPNGSREVVPSSGADGSPGIVIVELGTSPLLLPAYLSQSVAPITVEFSKGDEGNVESLLRSFEASCAQALAAQATSCTQAELEKIHFALGRAGITAFEKFDSLVNGSPQSLPPFVWDMLKSKVPTAGGVMLDFILSAKGDSRTPGPIPQDLRFNGLNDSELRVMFGLYTQALVELGKAPESAAKRQAIRNVQEYRNALQEELIKREVLSAGVPTDGIPRTGGPGADGQVRPDPYMSPRDWIRNNADKVGGGSFQTTLVCVQTPRRERCVVSRMP